MITLLKSTLKTFSLIFLFIVVGAPTAEANNFEDQQQGLFNKGNVQLESMSDSVEKVLDAYIASGGKIYWNDPKIKAPYKKYLGHFIGFNQTFETMWQMSQANFQKSKDRFAKISTTNQCSREANQKRRQAIAAFNNAKSGYLKALNTRDDLAQNTTEIGNLVLQGETNITDGFIDGAVYEFGTDYMIAPPPGQEGERMKPDMLNPLIENIYNYGSDTNTLFLSSFFTKFQSAIKAARKARSC
jgi:hypothetical protein